jgi:hypothetical protein
MSGQSSVVFEQQPVVEPVNYDKETVVIGQNDPIASFLEKHGTALVQNHEGQTVTVAEAVANCPPFAQLVSVMGEA